MSRKLTVLDLSDGSILTAPLSTFLLDDSIETSQSLDTISKDGDSICTTATVCLEEPPLLSHDDVRTSVILREIGGVTLRVGQSVYVNMEGLYWFKYTLQDDLSVTKRKASLLEVRATEDKKKQSISNSQPVNKLWDTSPCRKGNPLPVQIRKWRKESVVKIKKIKNGLSGNRFDGATGTEKCTQSGTWRRWKNETVLIIYPDPDKKDLRKDKPPSKQKKKNKSSLSTSNIAKSQNKLLQRLSDLSAASKEEKMEKKEDKSAKEEKKKEEKSRPSWKATCGKRRIRHTARLEREEENRLSALALEKEARDVIDKKTFEEFAEKVIVEREVRSHEATTLTSKARKCLSNNDNNQAIQCCDRALELDPKNRLAKTIRGVAGMYTSLFTLYICRASISHNYILYSSL